MPETPASLGLMMDVRERLVRIETKMDDQAKRETERDEREESLEARVTALETDATSARSSIRTLQFVGGAAVAVLGLFSGPLGHLFGS